MPYLQNIRTYLPKIAISLCYNVYMYPQVGQLFKCECGIPIARRVGINHFEIMKDIDRVKTKIGFESLPLRDGDPVQSKITCGKCGTEHILVTIQESVGINSSVESKIS